MGISLGANQYGKSESRATLLETFATTFSRALQETLYLTGQEVLRRGEGVAEVRFSAPNAHPFLVDLPTGIPNHGEVFIAADRPCGLIEAPVRRDEAPEAGESWLAVPGFA
jgi:urate oxidase